MSGHINRNPSLLSRFVRRIIIWVYDLKGWKLDGHLPKDFKKYVIAGAPHSSGWDYVFFLGATAEEGVRPNVMAKHTLFRWPMKNFLLDMGGIPIDKTKRTNAVEQMAEEFEKRDELALVIAAEGTRTTDGAWKSGFYNIAVAAKVPIILAWVCNERNILGFSEPIWPTGNYGEDLAKIAGFMRSKLPNFDRFKVLEAQAEKIKLENSA